MIYQNKKFNFFISILQILFMNQMQESYEVECLRGKRNKGKSVEYLVKWKDYPESENTWEPIHHFSGSPELIEEYELKCTQSSGKQLQKVENRQSLAHNIEQKVAKEELKSGKKESPKKKKVASQSRDKSRSRSRDRQEERSRQKKTKRSSKEKKNDEKQPKMSKEEKLKVISLFRDACDKYWFRIQSQKGVETVDWYQLLGRNYVSLIEFYEGHVRIVGSKD